VARGRSLPKLDLTAEERAQLQLWARSSKTTQALALRSRLVLSCAAANGNHEVARRFGVTPQTVGKWRARFLAKRLEGLIDEPRSGAPRKLRDDQVERLLATLLTDSPPAPGGHWSSRALAVRLGMSQSTVSRVLRASGLRVHAVTPLHLSIDTVGDIAGVYADGPLRAVALCVDDTRASASASELPERGPTAAPPPPTQALHRDATLIEALDQATHCDTGRTRGAGARPLVDFLRRLDARVPIERAVHVLVDDRGGRERPAFDRWFARKPRFQLHVAPGSVAWLAQVAQWFAVLGERPRKSGEERSTASLERAVREYIKAAPCASVPFLWITADRGTSRPPTVQ
jgi:transposase